MYCYIHHFCCVSSLCNSYNPYYEVILFLFSVMSVVFVREKKNVGRNCPVGFLPLPARYTYILMLKDNKQKWMNISN